VEQASETIVITDTKGTILYANPTFEKTTGYTRAEALGQNPRILKSGKQDAGFYRRMWDVLGRGEIWHGNFINQRKDGTLYEEEATISPMRDATGKIVNYVAVKRDVTHEVQLEAQFRQAQKMEAIGTLAGGVAHDFNNILAAIQMQAGLLKSEGGLSPAQSELADDIGIAVQRAVALTRQLLLFSRKQVLQLRDLDLNLSINEMIKMLTRILGENIAMQLNLAAQPMLLHADAGTLDQVLLNLCVNARDAMPDGGRLVIETSGVEFDKFAAAQSAQARPGSFVCLSVSDTGCGIPVEILPKIFEPFFTTKGVGKGTGLGLATVFGIVQQHQGWINVYSEVGHGTTFRVYLPRLAGMSEQKAVPTALTAMRGGKETILLVEDEESLRVLVRTALTRLGYRVLEASTGIRALEIWKEHREAISLLLTDLVMPEGMTGKELAQRLLQENPELKVVYMSGYGTDVVGRDFPLLEGGNFLAKPFQMQKLAQTIRDRLDARP
jgi:PAS domain S-box-containing protein